MGYWRFPVYGTEEPVDIPDLKLKAVIEDTLWIADPTPTDMLELIELDCLKQGIENIVGLEHATNLVELQLRMNAISDISPLSGCIRLSKAESVLETLLLAIFLLSLS